MRTLLYKKTFIGSSFVILCLALVAMKFSGRSAKATLTGTVKRQDLTQRVSITGQILPNRRLDVRAPFTGYVAKLFVKIGDRVKAQDPIVTFTQAMTATEASFPVRAAFNGVVTQVLKSEGEYVQENQQEQNLVVRVEDMSDLLVAATVPELDVAKVKIGQEAKVKVSALPGESFTALIEQIHLSAKDKDRWSSSSSEFQIRARLKTRDPRLYTGLSAVMDVITDSRKNVLSLAHEFIVTSDEKSTVTLMNGEKRSVKLGLMTDEAAEVIDGLKEGDQVKPVDYLSLPKMD